MSGYIVHILHKNCGYLVPSSKGLYALNLGNLLIQLTFKKFLHQIRPSELISGDETFYQMIISNLSLGKNA